MLSLARLSSMAVRLPIHTSSANTAPVASIFMPQMVTPSSPSATTCRVGSSRASPVKISAADAGGRRHRERDVEIVLARMFVIAGQILAESGSKGVEQRGLHRDPCDQACNVRGRAPDQAVSCIRDGLHGVHAADEVLPRAAAQPR